MEVYAHPTSSPTLQKALQATLPYSINLKYRTQHPNQTEHAHILATFSPSVSTIPQCWAAAYLDRSMRPETELWIFSTGEQPNHSESDKFCKDCKKVVLALVDYMSTLPTPPIRCDNLPAMDLAKQHEKEYPNPPSSGAYELSPGTYMRHLLMSKVVTLGAIQKDVLQVLHEAGVVRSELPGPDAELNKFLFKLSDLPETRELPQGLRWGEMREQDIDLVKSRTSIPRTTKTLMSLESVGVFEEETDTPVAWTFLGLDGSLVTLHTEEAYRGKGIAKAVAAKLFKQHAAGLAVDDQSNAWGHADVYTGNVQSESVCRSLGGKPLWRCFWVRIDLEKAGTLAGIA
ncbi:FR47 domain containing protein [Pyrenophora tritici-repentis]|nr:FR47 domain containing protein [Pyrenophora tritici-repentis]